MNTVNWSDPTIWEKIKYSKAEAARHFKSLDRLKIEPFDLKKQDKILREILSEPLIETYNEIENESNSTYLIDLKVGLKLYDLLKENLFFTDRLAAQDEIWRYLSLKILPDLVYKRFDLNEDRFYKQSRRIWLKTMWWYIHLSWQGTSEATYEILKNNTTDTISQLVERTGKNGYRVEMTRILMRKHYNVTKEMSAQQRMLLFRKVSKLTTARTKLIEPAFVVGGLESYVKDLYGYFEKNM